MASPNAMCACGSAYIHAGADVSERSPSPKFNLLDDADFLYFDSDHSR
ncbi:hypothetical protein BH10PSE19_BH10PSE19_22400 [soil metagenome]